MKTKEDLKKYSDYQLIDIANELNSATIPEKSELRKIAIQLFGSDQVAYMMMVGVPLSIELAQRLEEKKEMLKDDNPLAF